MGSLPLGGLPMLTLQLTLVVQSYLVVLESFGGEEFGGLIFEAAMV